MYIRYITLGPVGTPASSGRPSSRVFPSPEADSIYYIGRTCGPGVLGIQEMAVWVVCILIQCHPAPIDKRQGPDSCYCCWRCNDASLVVDPWQQTAYIDTLHLVPESLRCNSKLLYIMHL
jgi:hypothetical protein